MTLRYSFVGLLALSACATADIEPAAVDFGPVDEYGFVEREAMAIYHVATGLYCPETLQGLPRRRVFETRKDVDVACNYRNDTQIATLYLYKTNAPMQSELEDAVTAALQVGRESSLALSEDNSEICQSKGMTFNLLSSVMNLATATGEGENVITIDPTGATGPLPYMAAAMQGPNIRSYAAVSRLDNMVVKVRYSIKGGDDSRKAIDAECDALHTIMMKTSKAVGHPDGPVMDSFLTDLLETNAE